MKNVLSQIQQQKLTQEQVQLQSAIQVLSAKLTELPVDAFRERLQNELSENPYLEARIDGDVSSGSSSGGMDAGNGDEGSVAGSMYDARKDYSNEDDIPDYLLRQNNAAEPVEMETADSQSFYDQLMEQVCEYDLSGHERKVVEYLIGNLDDDGFLNKPLFQLADELSIYHYTDTTPEEVERLLHVLWQFDPAGVGARSLQECLMIQCRRRGYREDSLIFSVISNDWESITHNNWRKIQTVRSLSDTQLDLLRAEIKHLNPRPGRSMGEKGSSAENMVTPDFIVEVDSDGQIHLSLNETDIPTLAVSEDAMEMISEDFVKTYVSRGKLFISAILQRRQTMLKTMTAIIRLQKKFFIDGDEDKLRPMKLEDIATLTKQDQSTISRVCSSKFVETPYGTFPLKWFFSNSLRRPTSNGDKDVSDEQVATRLIKSRIKELIENEDKGNPYSDDILTELLNRESFPVARRTVAKYRDQLGIPTSRMRKI